MALRLIVVVFSRLVVSLVSSVCMPSSGIVELINREDWEEPL